VEARRLVLGSHGTKAGEKGVGVLGAFVLFLEASEQNSRRHGGFLLHSSLHSRYLQPHKGEESWVSFMHMPLENTQGRKTHHQVPATLKINRTSEDTGHREVQVMS
jgi:hypothetical protein